jgi:hypothetical protein
MARSTATGVRLSPAPARKADQFSQVAVPANPAAPAVFRPHSAPLVAPGEVCVVSYNGSTVYAWNLVRMVWLAAVWLVASSAVGLLSGWAWWEWARQLAEVGPAILVASLWTAAAGHAALLVEQPAGAKAAAFVGRIALVFGSATAIAIAVDVFHAGEESQSQLILAVSALAAMLAAAGLRATDRLWSGIRTISRLQAPTRLLVRVCANSAAERVAPAVEEVRHAGCLPVGLLAVDAEAKIGSVISGLEVLGDLGAAGSVADQCGALGVLLVDVVEPLAEYQLYRRLRSVGLDLCVPGYSPTGAVTRATSTASPESRRLTRPLPSLRPVGSSGAAWCEVPHPEVPAQGW